MTWITDPQTGDDLKTARRFIVKGFAFAGSRGIRQVEISTDGGESWKPTQLASALSPYSWVLWNFAWEPSRPGDHRILARATDGTGTLQSELEQESFPDGTTGIHEVIVTAI